MPRIECPSCATRLKVDTQRAGTKVRCPACRHRFVPDESAMLPSLHDGGETVASGGEPVPTLVNSPSASPGLVTESRVKASAATNVSAIVTGAVAAAVTTMVTFLVVPQIAHTYVGQLLARGWVTTAIVFLSSWSAAILVFKYFKVRRQSASLVLDVLPREISATIDSDTVERFREHVRTVGPDPSKSFLLNRVAAALDHFRYRQSAADVRSLLTSQSEIDEAAVDSSYTLVRTFIWAIPILGFVGTVLGIGLAVGSFSDSINLTGTDLDAIKNSLSGVTSGLGVAFNTTLIALVMSVVLMLPARWLQKSEEDLLNAVAAYCNEDVVMRLDDRGRGERDVAAVIREGFDQVAAGQQHAIERLVQHLTQAGSDLEAQLRRTWEDLDDRMRTNLRAEAEQLAENNRQLAADMQQFAAKWTEGFADAGSRFASDLVNALSCEKRQIEECLDPVVAQMQIVIEGIAAERRMLQEQVLPAQHRISRSMATLIEGVREVSEQLREESAAAAESQREHMQSLAQAVAADLMTIQHQVTESTQAQLKAAHASGNDISAAAVAVQVAVGEAGQTIARQVETMPELLKTGADTLGAQMVTATQAMSEQVATFSQDCARLGEVVRTTEAVMATLTDATESTRQAQQRSFEQMVTAAEGVRDQLASIGITIASAAADANEAAKDAHAARLAIGRNGKASRERGGWFRFGRRPVADPPSQA